MPIESMTGYARNVKVTSSGVSLVCEMRSVNGKSLDLRLRLPPGFDRLELPVRQALQAVLQRGNLQISIAAEQSNASATLAINEALVTSLLQLSDRLVAQYGLVKPTIGELLSIRGVMEGAAEADLNCDEEMLSLVKETVTNLKHMRAHEGAALVGIMLAQIDQMETLVALAEADPARTQEVIRSRLAAQVKALLDAGVGIDEQRLATEAVLLATKADIREELDRLTGHIAAVRLLLQTDGPVGRKLDFLSQEFNREANTLCSKSNAASITKIGLELKSVVDQFREQVQNLE